MNEFISGGYDTSVMNRPDLFGISPLMSAAWTGYFDCFQFLVDSGADVDYISAVHAVDGVFMGSRCGETGFYFGETALHCAMAHHPAADDR